MKLEDVKAGQRVKFNTNSPYNSATELTQLNPEAWIDLTVGENTFGDVSDCDGDVCIEYEDVIGYMGWALVNPECLDLVKEVE